MARIALPRIWVEDAQSRDLDIGVEVRVAGNLVTLDMTEAQVAEALSVADYDLGYQNYDSLYDPGGHLREGRRQCRTHHSAPQRVEPSAGFTHSALLGRRPGATIRYS